MVRDRAQAGSHPFTTHTSFIGKGKPVLSAHDPSSKDSLELAEGRVPQDRPQPTPTSHTSPGAQVVPLLLTDALAA